jgi:hypothetical protein
MTGNRLPVNVKNFAIQDKKSAGAQLNSRLQAIQNKGAGRANRKGSDNKPYNNSNISLKVRTRTGKPSLICNGGIFNTGHEELDMSLVFDVNDKIHSIIVKCVPANLPEAKKPYNLKPVHQPVLDIHAVASKADVYNITTDPQVIEAGLNDGLRLMQYLAADGYRIKTSLFSLRIRVPGEYEGNETSLPDGVNPVVRMGPSAEYREYVKERVKIDFSGIEPPKGYISRFTDLDEGEANSIFVTGNLFEIKGKWILTAGPDPSCGMFFVNVNDPSQEVRVTRFASNTRSLITGICPNTTWQYSKIVIRTQYMGSTTKFLKTVRVIESNLVIERV